MKSNENIQIGVRLSLSNCLELDDLSVKLKRTKSDIINRMLIQFFEEHREIIDTVHTSNSIPLFNLDNYQPYIEEEET